MKTITTRCMNCSNLFEKLGTEYRRSEKLGKKHYCSLKCSGKQSPIILDPQKYPAPTYGHRKPDQYAPFRHHLTRLRGRKQEVSITLADLKRIWDEQKGICPLTGWELYLRPTSKWSGDLCTPYYASLDRIDSATGYTPDNIRWISVMANFAKSSWNDEHVIEFCKAVAEYNK